MRLTELLPLLKELPHSDKLLLLHWLTSELLQESGLVPLNTQDRLANQGLSDSCEAAAVLAQALAEEKVVTHG